MQNWPRFSYKVTEVNTLAAGTVIAVATDAVVMDGAGTPSVRTISQGSLHMADPASQIATAGTPPTVAAPVVSLMQTDCFALQCIGRICWAIALGAIAWTDTATW
jgi:hypothetical protein